MWKFPYCLGRFNNLEIILLFSDSRAGAAPQKIDHAVIGGVVAVVMFAILCALIVLGRYFARHKGKSQTLQLHLIMTRSKDFFFHS